MNRDTFRAITVLVASLLSGCATTSTPELIEQAQLTDNWTAVNTRFEAMDEAGDQSEQMCPRGTKSWCVMRNGNESCSCVSDAAARKRLLALWRH